MRSKKLLRRVCNSPSAQCCFLDIASATRREPIDPQDEVNAEIVWNEFLPWGLDDGRPGHQRLLHQYPEISKQTANMIKNGTLGAVVKRSD